MHNADAAVCVYVPAIKAAESKQNFITGIKNVVNKVSSSLFSFVLLRKLISC